MLPDHLVPSLQRLSQCRIACMCTPYFKRRGHVTNATHTSLGVSPHHHPTALTTIRTMSTPPCRGMNPQIFEWPVFNTEALQVCDTCTVRAWCLEQVKPAQSYFDGVAGGHTWRDGELKCTSCLKTDDILINYMSRQPKRPAIQHELPLD
jgi:hypothetical protein